MKPFWSEYISAPFGEYEVELRDAAIPQHHLSRAEEKLLSEIFGTYGTWNRWRLVAHTHDLPEWKDPNSSSAPITIEEILRAQGATNDDVAEVLGEMKAVEAANVAFGSRS